ncbi:MAG: lipoprotein-releasing ABC transporter permease subunit [Burkholderiaceae bacterium]|nr:lipoprotein-releasing ABC transporter permease subunit [Burkholderiaceae bacterium]
MQTWPFEWQVGWRYLRAGRGGRSNRFISFISGVSMLGIALGVAALIVVLSVVNGFQREVRARMLDVIPHVQVDAAAAGLDWRTLAQRARAIDGMAAVAPVVIVRALLGRGDVLRGALLRGVAPADEVNVVPLAQRLRDGPLAALQPGARRIVLGAELARELKVNAGDAVVVVSGAGEGEAAAPRHHGFTVAGVFDSGHHEYDSTLALLHIDDALAIAHLSRAHALSVRLQDAQLAPAWARALAQRLDPRVAVSDWTRANRIWFAAVAQQKRMLGLILALIIAVAAFNLVATLVMTVTDKRADIAILRTLGASPRSVMAIFVVQGALAGLTGTLAGVLLGLAVAFNIEAIVPAIERLLGAQLLPGNVYLISRMPSDPQMGDIVPVALISIGLALLATLYPSWRASRVDPAQALRYD